MTRNEYIIIGLAIDEDDVMQFEGWANDEHSPGNIILLSDGQNNDYHIFGKLIAKGDEFEGLKWQHFDLILLSQYVVEVMKEIDDTMILGTSAQHLPIKLHILTHFQ